MQWLSEQLGALEAKAVIHAHARHTPGELRARETLMASTRALVDAIGARPGVAACFVAHDGLPLAASPVGVLGGDVEALAAVAQTCAATASRAGRELALGAVRQVVLVGADHKLALLLVGQLALGIRCPLTTHLGALLAE